MSYLTKRCDLELIRKIAAGTKQIDGMSGYIYCMPYLINDEMDLFCL